jgi:hypothetical protein
MSASQGPARHPHLRRPAHTVTEVRAWRYTGIPSDTKHDIIAAMWRVVYLPEAEQERGKLPGNERAALYNAVRKLQSIGPALGYPHTSAIAGTPSLRELRPRRGNSPWRAIYRQVGQSFVIAAVSPEAQRDPQGFRRACAAAQTRLAGLEE